MNIHAAAYELRTILREYLPLGSGVMTEAFRLVNALEEAAKDALLAEVRRMGT